VHTQQEGLALGIEEGVGSGLVGLELDGERWLEFYK